MAYTDPALLDSLLSHLADAMADYIRYQIDSGAQAVQIFDSWGGQLPPSQWDKCVSAAAAVAHMHGMCAGVAVCCCVPVFLGGGARSNANDHTSHTDCVM
jgi:uroporphyrinogen-III decarboxylase